MIKFKNFKNQVLKIHDDELLQYASSLAFHTILSLLPILMLSLSIFTQMPSFKEYYNKIKQFIFSNLLPSHQDVISTYLEQFIDNSVRISVVGVGAILFTSVMFFMDFEYIIANLTKSKKRGFWRGVSAYWTLITLAPIGLGFSFYISTIMQLWLDKNFVTRNINLFFFLPYLFVWGIFAVTYAVSINKDIAAKNLLLGSFVAGFIWNTSKLLFIEFTLYNKTYLSLYGSFSIILFFFLWIYISWVIFLYGVKICCILEEETQAKKRQNSCDEPKSNSDQG